MTPDQKLLEFPIQPDPEDIIENVPDQESESFKLDENNPLTDKSEKELGKLLGTIRDMLGIMEQQWQNSQKEYNLTEPQMQALYKYNEDHRTPPPEGVDENDETQYDRFNGFKTITPEQVVEIFGEGHPIIGIEHTITLDRIKYVTGDFLSWLLALREYNNIYNAYNELIEFKEEEEMKQLQKHIDEAGTPEQKEKCEKAMEQYYYNKYLGFVGEPMKESDIKLIIQTWHSQEKIGYWVEKARMKLKQIKVPDNFILAISSFEKRFMNEKYHSQDNVLLLYFLSKIGFETDTSPKSLERARMVCMIVALQRFIRNRWNDEIKAIILGNIEKLEDQFLGRMNEFK